MNQIETVKLSVVYRDEDKNVAGGIDFYWPSGGRTVMYQEWEYRCSGNAYSQVKPDPMLGNSLLDYFLQNWQDKEGIHFEVKDAGIFH